MSINEVLRQKLDSMSPDEKVQLYQDLNDLPDGVCPDQGDSHYVITNGSAFLTEFRLEGRGYRYNFRPKGAILFDNEVDAQMVLSLLFGLSTWDFSIDRSHWMIKKLTVVNPRVKFTKIRRKLAKAYIRCQKAADADGYIHCQDCGNHGCFSWCGTNGGCLEFCENFYLKENLYNDI